ncbi:MAG: c-type cytochrome, partial [Alphaproteobacteria bacterium]|nr:c-type cytochrome [Alphaproteobacteria bacterium]
LLGMGAATAAPSSYPDWAYGVPTKDNEATAPKDDGTRFTLPGAAGTFTRGQTAGANHTPPADWYPGDHPTMPKIISAGDTARGITACAGCHYPNGKGRPQNANIAGLNADYLARQLREMKSGARHSAEPRKHNAQQMVDFARAMTDAEITEAAAYYASLAPTVPIKVVQTAMVPQMRSQEGMWLPHESGAREPIGVRVIETPADVNREQLRDPHAGFIAYVPTGAPTRGKRLAVKLGCAGCHGEGLKGADAPGIAGRSPSYLARQLYDFQQGSRHGEMAAAMQPIVEKLTAADIVNLTAYAASLPVK